jgi:hypothetical protein
VNDLLAGHNPASIQKGGREGDEREREKREKEREGEGDR